MEVDSKISSDLDAGVQGVAATSRGKSILRDVVETIALFLVVFTLSQLLLGNFMIEQRSAYPHFVPGDRILVDKVFYRLGGLQRGDMIVGRWVTDPTDVFKRIIGLPGDKVQIIDSKVYINGKLLPEPYLEPGVYTSLQIPGKSSWQLGADEYFVMGDNRTEIGDSRGHGPMKAADIVGRAWLRYWPLSKFTLIK